MRHCRTRQHHTLCTCLDSPRDGESQSPKLAPLPPYEAELGMLPKGLALPPRRHSRQNCRMLRPLALCAAHRRLRRSSASSQCHKAAWVSPCPVGTPARRRASSPRPRLPDSGRRLPPPWLDRSTPQSGLTPCRPPGRPRQGTPNCEHTLTPLAARSGRTIYPVCLTRSPSH